jgi:Lrp/AsnC family leucine-responsive transcriptional regulator
MIMLNTKLDKIDRRILMELQNDARIANVGLAECVGLSPSPCLRRVKQLEAAGIIRRYSAVIDPARVGLGLSCFISVTLERNVEQVLEAFEEAISERPEILECWPTTGEADFLLKVVTADLGAYERLMRDHLLRIPGISSTKTSLLLTPVKNETALPLDTDSK